MKKNILNILLIIIIGGFSGVVFSSILIPKLSDTGLFSSLSWLNNFKDQTIIINKTENINIKEDVVLKEVIEKNRLSELSIKSFKDNNFLSSGSGFIVSSDGLIITRSEVISSLANKIIVNYGEEEFSAKIFKTLDKYSLVLLKADISNLPLVSFVDSYKDVPLGSKIILIGTKNGSNNNKIKFVNIGFIKSIDNFIFETTIKEDIIYSSGTPLINLDGEVVGINFTNSSGYVFSVSADIIKKFLY